MIKPRDHQGVLSTIEKHCNDQMKMTQDSEEWTVHWKLLEEYLASKKEWG